MNINKNLIILVTLLIIVLIVQNSTIRGENLNKKIYNFSDPLSYPDSIYSYFRFDEFTAKGVQKEWRMAFMERDSIKPVSSFAQDKVIDLSGVWKLALDSIKDKLIKNTKVSKFPLTIKLPGTTDEAGYGKKHIPGTPLVNGESEIWGLARRCSFVGKAWYQKSIIIPEDWKNKEVTLFLERCLWETKVWVNGVYAGEEHSLCAPHTFKIGDQLKPGENIITLCIDNSPYVHLGSWSHGYAPGIQTIWNGVVGDIKLTVSDKIFLDNIKVYPSFKNQKLRITGNIIACKPGKKNYIELKIKNKSNKQIFDKKITVKSTGDTTFFETTFNLNNKLKPWDEFNPNLYSLEIKLNSKSNSDLKKVRFGIRDFEAKGENFIINGHVVFMRGEHDAGSFPLTGYPSMEKKDWIRIFKIGKEYGFNHWRFHSWCPPEAAFEAADEIGIYMQPELTLFSQDWEHTLVGTDPARDAFLFEELKKLLDTYGNHPSFVLMCMGNELRGDPKVLEEWVRWGKNYDSRHLYAGTTNLEAMALYERLDGDDFQVAHAGKFKGKRVARRMYPYFNNEVPNTYNDYSNTLQPPFDQWPIMSHETGQWTVFPDFSEIKKYTGIFAPRNFEVFKSRLQQKSMLNQAHDFLMASGKLSALLYREEMERLLRTPGMAGFQLLDLRDYQAQGSAMIGMLNAFWESKGITNGKEFRQSNNDVTLLLKMKKRIWLNNETFKAELVIPNYSAADIGSMNIIWSVSDSKIKLFDGNLKCKDIKQGKVNPVGNISFDLKGITAATKLQIYLSYPELKINNSYNIWIYPKNIQENEDRHVIIATRATPELLQKIEDGATVLLVPNGANGEYDAERMTFTTPFWSTILFSYQIKTMGILCNPEHPVFNFFPTDYYTNWQWWDLVHKAYVVRLNQTKKGYKPIIQVIDHPVRNDKLGAVMETKIGNGKLLVSTLDILSDLEKRPVARQLRYSILKYMQSDKFDPQEEEGIKDAFFNNTNRSGLRYDKIKASSENAEHPVFFAVDKSNNTWWENNPDGSAIITVNIELNKPRYITGCKMVSTFNSEIDYFKVYVSDSKEKIGDAVIIGHELNTDIEAKSWDNGFTIQKGKKGKYIKIEIKLIHGNKIIKINELNFNLGD